MMNLDESVVYANKLLAEGHHSDGCTFAPDFWIKDCCVTHDFLMRFRPVSPWRADWIYFLLMINKGFIFAPIYYVAVTLRTTSEVMLNINR